ncbi:MAG: polysaccharide deacetylase family protein [Rhizobiaceae bacterium]|nr:polysaccharide deacetylase family protein [Rhizobiaceae bacterium]
MIDWGEAARRFVLNGAHYSGLAPLLRSRLGGLGAILMLHRVTDAPHTGLGINRHLAITPRFLDAVLTELKRMGYRFVSMDEAVARIVDPRPSERFIALTADDAYRDNLLEAVPVLEKHEAPIAIYVAPGLTSREADLWWDLLEDVVTAREELYITTPEGRTFIECSTPAQKETANRRIHDYLTTAVREEDRQAILREMARLAGVDYCRPSRETLMDWDEVRRAAAHPLVTIGAHTVNHYNLKRLSDEKAWTEIVDASRIIEVETGEKPRHMAYPYGYESAVGEREVALAEAAGFASAVTTRHGVLQVGHAQHLQALPRISVNGRYQRVAHMRTMVSGVTTPLANQGKTLVTT